MITINTTPSHTSPTVISNLGAIVIAVHPTSLTFNENGGYTTNDIILDPDISSLISQGRITINIDGVLVDSNNLDEVIDQQNSVYSSLYSITFYRKNNDFISVDTSTWQTIGKIDFPGLDNVVSVSTLFTALGWLNSPGTGYIRAYDYTNHKVICELSINSITFQHVDCESYENSLPQSPAVIEIQAKAPTNNVLNISTIQLG